MTEQLPTDRTETPQEQAPAYPQPRTMSAFFQHMQANREARVRVQQLTGTLCVPHTNRDEELH